MHFYSHNDSNDGVVILPLFFPYALVKFLQTQGIDQNLVLAGTGVTPNSLRSLDTRISHINHTQLLKNAEQVWAKPGLGLAFGRTLLSGHDLSGHDWSSRLC